MICIHAIQDNKLQELLKIYETTLKKNAALFNTDIPEYTYYISRILKCIQNSGLIDRIELNSSFENKLLEYGYNINSLPDEQDLKKILLDIAKKVCLENQKAKTIYDILKTEDKKNRNSKKGKNKILIISNNNDEDIIKEFVEEHRLSNIEISRYKNFIKRKEDDLKEYYIIGYFLEGNRDFEIYHNLSTTINLFLYDFEIELFAKIFNLYKKKLEAELLSEDRFVISGIKYEIPPPIPVTISQTLQSIIDRTKEMNDVEFDNIIDDPDEGSNEYIIYHVEYEDYTKSDVLKITDTVFDYNNNITKVAELKTGDKIRVYNLDFGEVLLNTAMEFQAETFSEIERHSRIWKEILKDLYIKKYKEDIGELHKDLSSHDIKVKRSTIINNWINGKTKFPQKNTAIKFIYELSNIFTNELYQNTLKSKKIYNSTMISLGRDLKEEIKNYLLYGNIGELIQKNNINSETLKKAIESQMPLKKIKTIKEKLVNAEELDE